ncbi:MAG: sulfite exporter TauE/SafE family protein, partial [Bacillota bacterium]
IAGGGGLLTVPAIWLTGIDTHGVMGTNKGQSVFGSGTSLWRFTNSSLLDRRRALQSFVPALAGAAVGAQLVLQVPPRILTALIMTLLLAVAIFVVFQRPPQVTLAPRSRPFWIAAAVALTLAFYDGFFGPGTGTFLIFAYTLLWHDPLDAASANAKVVNFASNFASMITFAAQGQIHWRFAAPMAIGQILGGYLGTHLTIRLGRPLVRYTVVAVSVALILCLAWRLT